MAEPVVTWEQLQEYIETQCEPLTQEEEIEVDQAVLALTVAALPEKAGFSYDELAEQVEAVRHPKDAPMPNWAWEVQFFGASLNRDEAVSDKQLWARIVAFTNLFSELLAQATRERGLVYGVFLIAPYVVVRGGDGGRLYRPKAEAPILELQTQVPGRAWALSMMPAQTVDRAARGIKAWSFPAGDAPVFEDVNNKHTITYFANGLTLEALREGVTQLNPRTADVWRLATAAILEAWSKSEREPPRVWLDARQLCDAMGFKKHKHGGHRPENVATAARALVDLERFYITIPYGTKHYPEDANGKRKKTTVQARAQHRVLAVLSKEEAKEVSEAEYLPMRWLVTAGEWIKDYPREQFAPLFRALVELPGTYTPDLWAKALGTELVWQYRQSEGKVKTQRVETMLRQACVLEEAHTEKNKKRVRDSFEKAMDALQASGVCASWEYSGPDIDQVEAATKGWFELWLQVRVTVTPPAGMTKLLENVAETKKEHQRRSKRAA